MSTTEIYARFARQPYRPAPTQGAPFVVRRFNADGTLASEIGLFYRNVAEELVAKHQARGLAVTLTENGGEG